MSFHRQLHSASSLSDTSSGESTSSRSSSTERASYPMATPSRTHHHHSASAPPSFATRIQSDRLTSKSSYPSSSTLVSSDDEKATSGPSPATKVAATHSTKPKKKAKNPPSASKPDKLKVEGGCLDFDWSYHNVYSSGSSHGRKTIGGGSGSVGACALM